MLIKTLYSLYLKFIFFYDWEQFVENKITNREKRRM